MIEQIGPYLPKIILAVGIAIALALIIKEWKRIRQFISEVKSELTKVSWSTRQELIGATWVVIVTTAMLAVFIGLEDFVLSKMLHLIIKL